MKISKNRMKLVAVLATTLFVLSIWLTVDQAIAVENSESTEKLRFIGSTLSARRALEGEVHLATKSGTLTSINPEVIANLPKLKQVFDGADPRHQQRIEWCAANNCAEGGPEWPGDTFERRPVSAEEASIVLSSIPKFDYVEERILDKNLTTTKVLEEGAAVSRFYQAIIQYNDKYYVLIVNMALKFLEKDAIFVSQSLYVGDTLGGFIPTLEAGKAIMLNARVDGNPKGLVHIMQVKNANGTMIQLNWLKVSEPNIKGFDVSYSFVPIDKGEYKIESFVWQSLSGTPLTEVQELRLRVIQD